MADVQLGDRELEVMTWLWANGSGTVGEVKDGIDDPLAYTTVLTMMKILEQKGYVKKTREERAFVYRPARPQQQVIGSMVREFVERVFDGASRPMLLHLVKQTKLSDRERKALLKAIEEVDE